jgi:hypothetical protein
MGSGEICDTSLADYNKMQACDAAKAASPACKDTDLVLQQDRRTVRIFAAEI